METQPLPHAGPSVGNYLSSREFVAAYDTWARRALPTYTRRAFAKWAKIRSPNFLSLVIFGKRPLQGEWLEAFMRAAKLPEADRSLLKELCEIENEREANRKTDLLRAYHAKLLSRHQHSLALQQLSLLRNPLAWTLLQVIALRGSGNKVGWFKRILRGKPAATKIHEAFATLEACDLVEATDTRWISTHRHYRSPDQIRSAENAVFHEQMLQEAAKVLKTYDPADRSFGSLTFSVRHQDEAALKDEIQKFGERIATKYSRSAPVDGNCYRLNLQLYSLTQTENPK